MRTKKFTLLMVLVAAVLFAIPAQAFLWNWAEQTPQFKSKSGLANTENVRQPLWKFTGRELSNFRRFDGQSPVQAGRRAATKDEHGLITAPDEGVTKYYKRAGMGYYVSSGSVYSAEQSGHVKIVEAEDGTVYIKDPVSHYAQGTWVVGTKEGNTITVAAAQPLAWNSNYSATLSLNWGNLNGNTYVRGEGDITFTVDDEAGTITLDGSSQNKIIGVFWDDDDWWEGVGDYSTVWTVDPNYQPASTDLIVLPDGAEVQQWYAEGAGSTAVPTDVNVAFVGSDVYISGLCANFPEAWIKGTLEGTTVTFSGLQFVGMYSSTMPIWAVGADADTGNLLDAFTMTYDSEAQTLTLDEGQFLVFNASEDKMYYLSYIQSLTIYAEEPAPAVIDELPYVNSFDDAASQKQFTIIDANEDGRTWNWYNGMARYTYHQTNQGNDWLISPQIYLQAGKTYIFNILAHAQSSTYPERIEVKVAKVPETDNNAPTAALMAAGNEVIAPSDVTTAGFVTFTNDAFTVAETGYYYIGVHAISDADRYYLYVDDFEVKLKEPEDIEISPESGADIATALATAEEGKNVKNITINLAEGGEYTVSKTLTAPNNILLKGDARNPATITMAEGMTDNIITLDGTTALAKKADGTDSDHKLIGSVDISGVKIVGIKGALVKDNQKTLVEQLTIADAIVEMPASGKNVLDFNGKGYVGEVVVKNSTIYANGKNTGFFAQYGSRPNNLKVDGYEVPLQIFDVQNSTIVNIANGKNFCDLKQNGTAQNVYVIKNNIFTDCGKPNQVVVGFNKGQTSATPTWDVDGNVFNCAGADGSVAEVSKTGKKNEEDIVKNSIAGIVTFTDAAAGDFNGTFTAAPVEEPVEESASRRDAEKATLLNCGDPRWTIVCVQGYAINIDAKFGNVTTAPASYAAEGEEVTITATANPADKFEVKSVKVEGKTSDLEVVVTPDAETPGKFTFTMPADAVNIIATFQRIAEDIIVNPEDIEGGDITAALNKKIAALVYTDPQTQEEVPGRVKDITINLAEGEAYTVAAAIKAPANVTINGNGATIDASGADANFIELQGSSVKAIKADGETESDHYLIDAVTINEVTVNGLKKAIIRDTQKTLLKALTIENSVIEASDGKPALDFDGKGYIEQVTVNNSTVWSSTGTNKFFAKYGSRPKNLWSGDDAGPYTVQGFDVQNSTFVNIANSKNFCDISQKGTVNNVYTLKNNIFVNCGKSGQVVVGFNGGQTSATPVWDVDGNVFNYDGNDVSAAEVSKAGQKDDEDIVKNSLPCRVLFSAVETPDFGGILVLAPGTEAPETKPGDPRWTYAYKNSFAIDIDTKYGNVTTVPASYAAEGEEVTITAKPSPADKFELLTLKAEGVTSEQEIELTPVEGTTDQYTFTMPADAVNIIATFQRIAEDIIVNPEDIEGGDITAALNKKIAALVYTDPQTQEEVPGRVKDITINLAEGEAYTVAAAIKAPANVTINGNGATIDASGADANFIELQGSSVKAIKADGETESDHYLIDAVTINEVTVNGLKKAIIRDTQKTLLKALTIENSVIEASDGKPALDFDGKGYIEQVTVNNSTVWSSTGTNKFFAKYGSRPKNLWSGDDAGPYTVQGFDVQNSTFVNIANSKNFCDISQKGTVNNVYTLKNNIFVNCGKSGQVVVGFNGGQTSATPVWDVDGNVFNYDGNDVSAAEVSKAGKKADEDIVKNSLPCRVLFSDVEKPDFGGILVLAPGTEAPETLPGDPRWSLSVLDGNTITVQTSNGHGTASAQYPYAIEGEEVGLTIKPEDGYEVESIVILDADGYVIGLVTGDTFTMPGQDVVIYVGFKKTATGIDAIENDADFEEGAWYTINGVRVDQPTKKGLYIHNGKKIVIK